MSATKYVGVDGSTVDRVLTKKNRARVVQGKGYVRPGFVSCEVTNTGNGFIARFPAFTSWQQDHYVVLDYTQARDLLMALAAFKKILGFEDCHVCVAAAKATA